MIKGKEFFAISQAGINETVTDIHPTAIVAPDAEIEAGVSIGPYAVIGGGVRMGAGSTVGAHAVVKGPATIGPALLNR